MIRRYVIGKVIETAEGTDAKAGDNLYLTIDANLQKAAYDILEQELAGILLAKMADVLDYDRSVVEDAGDAVSGYNGSAYCFALCLGIVHTAFDPLADNVSFHFTEYAHHFQHTLGHRVKLLAAIDNKSTHNQLDMSCLSKLDDLA